MTEHQIYVGTEYPRPNVVLPLGKCTCGSVLHGQTQIDEHREATR